MISEIKNEKGKYSRDSKTHLLRQNLVVRPSFDLLAAILTFALVLSIVVGAYLLLRAQVSSGYLSVVGVIAGIFGLILGVSTSAWLKERMRRNRIKELRDSNKSFFEQVEKDITSRLSEKVR